MTYHHRTYIVVMLQLIQVAKCYCTVNTNLWVIFFFCRHLFAISLFKFSLDVQIQSVWMCTVLKLFQYTVFCFPNFASFVISLVSLQLTEKTTFFSKEEFFLNHCFIKYKFSLLSFCIINFVYFLFRNDSSQHFEIFLIS